MKIKTFQEYCEIFNLQIKVIKLEDIIQNTKKFQDIDKKNIFIEHNKRIFKINKELIPIVKKILEYNNDYYHKIKYIGRIIWSTGPSQNLLNMTYEKNKDKAIRINEKASYLYSKKSDIFYESIENINTYKEIYKKTEHVLVLDFQNNPIGIGEIKLKKNKFDKNDIAIYNSYNLSRYLR